MLLSDPSALSALQRRSGCIRNVCIIAHVDHGKTSLSDHLLSSNGVISRALAGKARFLDSRPDEQERKITMKSSSIALLFHDKRKADRDEQQRKTAAAAPRSSSCRLSACSCGRCRASRLFVSFTVCSFSCSFVSRL